MADHLEIWPPLAGILFALVCLIGALRSGKRRRLIDNLPTCKTTGVFIGLVEVKGMAETPEPMMSFLAESHCVFFQWYVEEEWSRIVTETETDSDGKSRTVTRRIHWSGGSQGHGRDARTDEEFCGGIALLLLPMVCGGGVVTDCDRDRNGQ